MIVTAMLLRVPIFFFLLIADIPLLLSFNSFSYSKMLFTPPKLFMARMLSDETKAVGYVTPGELTFPAGLFSGRDKH